MATITEEEKRFIKGVFKHYPKEYNGQEILGLINKRRAHISQHINIGRISEVKNDNTITPMSKKEVNEWIREVGKK